ncbi:MAG TPA: hypothetical protein VJH95_06075 [Candidatus Nanoarchaeia archaeon]|nr:hypothetical protein [Candidatus Nanoarchaeia archaeon]
MVAALNYKKLILVSLILSFLIFISGLLIGLTFDELRTNDLTIFLNENEFQTESYLIERQFLEDFGQDKCSLAQTRVVALSDQLGEIGRTLTRYESKRLLTGEKYLQLKSKYLIFEIKLYTILKELNDNCKTEDKPIILFFYDTNDQASIQQGYILDSLVNKEKATVFSIDREFNDPLLETVKHYYNITKSPTVIINFNITKEGLTSLAELTNPIKNEA